MRTRDIEKKIRQAVAAARADGWTIKAGQSYNNQTDKTCCALGALDVTAQAFVQASIRAGLNRDFVDGFWQGFDGLRTMLFYTDTCTKRQLLDAGFKSGQRMRKELLGDVQ